jgi:hypothetical protein
MDEIRKSLLIIQRVRYKILICSLVTFSIVFSLDITIGKNIIKRLFPPLGATRPSFIALAQSSLTRALSKPKIAAFVSRNALTYDD